MDLTPTDHEPRSVEMAERHSQRCREEVAGPQSVAADGAGLVRGCDSVEEAERGQGALAGARRWWRSACAVIGPRGGHASACAAGGQICISLMNSMADSRLWVPRRCK